MRPRLFPSFLAASLSLTILAAYPVAAQSSGSPPTASDAAALRDQLRAWFSGLLGPDRKLPAPPLVVTPEGGRYRIALPLGPLFGRADVEASVLVRKLDGGRWAVESLRLPNGGNAPQGQLPSPDKQAGDPVFTWTLGSQSMTGEVDPSLATPSGLDLEMRDIVVDGTENGNTHRQTIARYGSRLAIAPAAARRLPRRLMDVSTCSRTASSTTGA